VTGYYWITDSIGHIPFHALWSEQSLFDVTMT